MPEVALLKCSKYDPALVKASIAEGLALIGGIEKFISPKDKLLLKPNLLAAVAPERAVTTHPEIFRAVVSLFLENEIQPYYGDGPGVISLRKASIKTGFKKVAKENNINEVDIKSSQIRKFPKGIQNRSFEVYKSIDQFNKIISLPKFKTHNLTRITGAVKNQFGMLSFSQKRKFHAALQEPEQFARMLLDLNACINPCLYIVDAIQAMEGDGPMNGTPINLGLIAISDDPIALDATLCRIIDLDPYQVQTIRMGEVLGFGVADLTKINIVGNSIGDFIKKEFRVNRQKDFQPETGGMLNTLFNSQLKVPVVDDDKCIGCGDCIRACPTEPKALAFAPGESIGIPVVNSSLCISCYCCSETCVHHAISLVKKGFRKGVAN
jgi:uncharacterized protein (DUF362 family)/Pyruvate/2-oxoacid:ferredoxin oxidoreductase delta subunit